MSQEAKILSIIAAITILLLGGGIFLLSRNQPQTTTDTKGQTVYQLDYTKGEKLGTDSAKIKVAEFGDFQCPACKAAEPTVEKIINEDKSNPNFQFIFFNYPLPMHQYAQEAANTAMAAASVGKFWPMHDALYANQDDWATSQNLAELTQKFTVLGNQLGIDPQLIQNAVNNRPYANQIQSSISLGDQVGITGTPTFFINGKMVTIQNSYSELETQVNNALKQ